MEQKSNKKRLFLALKFVVSSAFLYFVLKKAGAGNVVTHLFSVDPLYFLAAVVVYIIATYISAVRWKLFLDEDIGLGRLFSLYMIGTFFNNVMPGMVGGDAVKAYYLYSDTKRGGSSLGSVFMDRYSGLFALLSIGLVTSMFVLDELGEIGMQWAMPLLFSTFIMGTAVVLGLRAGRRVKVVGEFYDHFIRYLRNREVMVKTFLLSIVIQLLAILMIYFIILGMGRSPSFISLFVFMPIIITVTSIPITISGFGVREGAFVLLFGLVGFSPEVATSISLLWFLSIAFASIIGFIEYLRYRKKPLR